MKKIALFLFLLPSLNNPILEFKEVQIYSKQSGSGFKTGSAERKFSELKLSNANLVLVNSTQLSRINYFLSTASCRNLHNTKLGINVIFGVAKTRNGQSINLTITSNSVTDFTHHKVYRVSEENLPEYKMFIDSLWILYNTVEVR
ncbi:hypothetical protein [uncultured Fibrella sp.]|uniref:hypothetical protein n=1 Tax=uncultured Fibrella sp. TaxID=1284596 RepID=UPI0035CA09DA